MGAWDALRFEEGPTSTFFVVLAPPAAGPFEVMISVVRAGGRQGMLWLLCCDSEDDLVPVLCTLDFDTRMLARGAYDTRVTPVVMVGWIDGVRLGPARADLERLRWRLQRPARKIQRAWRAHRQRRREAAARVIERAVLHALHRPGGRMFLRSHAHFEAMLLRDEGACGQKTTTPPSVW
jgi:hypothetical protein